MGYVFIIFFILSFFIVTFALLHLLAGGAALLKGDKTTGNILVFAGGLIALPTIPLLAVLPGIPFLTWILGATLCCVGAYMNGKEKGNINKSHQRLSASPSQSFSRLDWRSFNAVGILRRIFYGRGNWAFSEVSLLISRYHYLHSLQFIRFFQNKEYTWKRLYFP